MGEGASGESSEEKPAVFLFSPSPLSRRFRVLPRSRQCIYEPKTRTRQKKKKPPSTHDTQSEAYPVSIIT